MNKQFTFYQFRGEPQYSLDMSVRIPFLYEQERKRTEPFDKRIEQVQKDFLRVYAEIQAVETKLKGSCGLWETWCLRGKLKSRYRQSHTLNELLDELTHLRYIAR